MSIRAVAASAAAVLVMNPTAAVAAQPSVRKPVANIANPGVLRVVKTWVVMSTGTRGIVSTAQHAEGPYTTVGHVLQSVPGWANPHQAFWAPSAVQVDASHFVATFSAALKGEKYLRCIGIAFSSTPTGPYTADSHPLSCPGGKYGAPDRAQGTQKNDQLIDATPRLLSYGGGVGLFITYKTQHKVNGHYYSTIRLVQPDAYSGVGNVPIVRPSVKITTRPTNIEENPVIVQRGSVYTLFTSLGGYTTCNYHTEYRQTSDLYSWPQNSTRLSFPAGTNTCGQGDADVYPSGNSYRIFWGGRKGGGFKMYVGKLDFNANGKPAVTKIL